MSVHATFRRYGFRTRRPGRTAGMRCVCLDAATRQTRQGAPKSLVDFRRRVRRNASMRRDAGETLVETLAAILIISFAVILLTTGLTTASRLNAHAQERSEKLVAARTGALLQSDSDAESQTCTVSITVKDESTYTYSSVSVYGGEGIYSWGPATVGSDSQS